MTSPTGTPESNPDPSRQQSSEPKFAQPDQSPTSGAQNPPPPGYGEPQFGTPQQPSYGQPQYGNSALPPSWGSPSSMLGMKPGIIPLRPLTLGEILDGAFQAIRRHSRVTLGLTLLITSIFVVAFTALWALVMPWVEENFGRFVSEQNDADLAIGSLSWLDQQGIISAGSIGMSVATIIVTGTLVYAVGQLSIGRRPSASEIWRRVKPRIWALLGLTVLTYLIVFAIIALPFILLSLTYDQASIATVSLVTVLFILAALGAIVMTVMLLFAAPALILEETTVLNSIKRSWVLVKSSFWRVLGVWVLTYLIVMVIQQLIIVPLVLIGTLVGIALSNAFIWIVLVTAASILAATIGVSYSASVVALQYIDIRMRKEGLDVQLAATVQAT